MIWPLAAVALLSAVPFLLLARADRPRLEAARNDRQPAVRNRVDDPEPPTPIEVRPLKSSNFRLGLGSKGMVLESLDTDKRFLPYLEEVEKQINARREKVVLVYFETGGPPFGVLKYKIHKREVEFYCEEPKLGPRRVRKHAERQVMQFFAVPRGAKVRWGGFK
jgi:hypothetical protein